MHLLFLSTHGLRPTQQVLLSEAVRRGHAAVTLKTGDITWTTTAGGLAFTTTSSAPLPRPHLVYWAPAHGDTYGQALVEAMAHAGWPMFPSPFLPMSDKVTQAGRLGASGVPVPVTYVLARGYGTMLPASWPLVLKKPHSSRGEGVRMVPNPEALSAMLDDLGLGEGDMYVLQQPVQPLGRDVRAFFINGTCVAAMERTAPAGDFRANMAAGGRGTATTLTEGELTVCTAAWQAIGGAPWAGVDFIRSAAGPFVLEVNLWPGFLGLKDATDIPLERLLVDDLERAATSLTVAL